MAERILPFAAPFAAPFEASAVASSSAEAAARTQPLLPSEAGSTQLVVVAARIVGRTEAAERNHSYRVVAAVPSPVVPLPVVPSPAAPLPAAPSKELIEGSVVRNWGLRQAVKCKMLLVKVST